MSLAPIENCPHRAIELDVKEHAMETTLQALERLQDAYQNILRPLLRRILYYGKFFLHTCLFTIFTLLFIPLVFVLSMAVGHLDSRESLGED
jgi:hypothetical protein